MLLSFIQNEAIEKTIGLVFNIKSLFDIQLPTY
jgi:hypothetical protein